MGIPRVIDGVEVRFDPAAIPPWLRVVLELAGDSDSTGLTGEVTLTEAAVERQKGANVRLVEELDRQELQRARDMHDARRSVGLEGDR